MIALIITLALISSLIVYAENSYYTITGYVKDVKGNPLKNAKIIIFKLQENVWKLVNITFTQDNGKYEVNLEKGYYKVIVTHDLNSTPGFDYTIHIKEVKVESNIEVNFTLMKAASIIIKGKAITAATDEPAKYAEYRVEILDGNETPGLMKNFGMLLEYSKNIGITDRTIVIPAQLNVNIIVQAAFLIEREITTLKFNLTEKPIQLNQGESIEIEIERASLAHSIKMVEEMLSETQELIKEAEKKEFYMSIFKSKLSRVSGLIHLSKAKLEEGKYEACYVDLREAFISILNIKEKIKATFSEASSSTSMIIFLLALTSTVCGEIIFEKRIGKITATIILYIITLSIFYTLFPGAKLVNLNDTTLWAIMSIIITEAIITWPQLIKEKPGGTTFRSILASIFSLAKRNLKRRKLRTILTILSILILIGGFVSLTSVSIEEGLMERTYENNTKIRGILVDKIKPTTVKQPFIPLDRDIIKTLNQREDVLWTSIKFETLPSISPIDYMVKIEEAENKLPIFGIISFSNRADPIYREMEERLIDGRMPEKSGEIVIPKRTSSTLNLKVGDYLYLVKSRIKVKISGIVSDNAFSIIDYDGRILTPSKIVMIDGEEPIIEVVECEVEEIIFLWWEDASKISAFPSRIIASLEDEEKIVVLAKNIALRGGYRTLAFISNKTLEYRYGTYLETRGMEATLSLILSIFNVSIVMLSSVYERRREIMILSALGLNPSHISMLFSAEALILGIISGGLGYIVGLTFYKIARILGLFIEVYPKVSITWTSATIGIAIAVAIAGTIPALKSSVIVTPSKLMKWKADKKPSRTGEPWKFSIPIRIKEDEVLDMLRFTYRKLSGYMGIEQLKINEKELTLRFRYTIGRGTMGTSSSVNQLKVFKENSEIKITLTCKAYGESPEKHAYEAARLVRLIILQWRSEKII